jgi:hypothetical protein
MAFKSGLPITYPYPLRAENPSVLPTPQFRSHSICHSRQTRRCRARHAGFARLIYPRRGFTAWVPSVVHGPHTHPPQSVAMIKGHLDQTHKNQRSTKPPSVTASPSAITNLPNYPLTTPFHQVSRTMYARITTTPRYSNPPRARFILIRPTNSLSRLAPATTIS